MNWSFSEMVKACSTEHALMNLCKSKHGLERECLRTTLDGDISQASHPVALGSALTNPYITTDFSEAQLELVTPPYTHANRTLTFLRDLHRYVYSNLKEETIWPFSTPCHLPDQDNIPLAQFGSSDLGIEKYLYRSGLSFRYGRKMQTLSGIHYNFSLSEAHWDHLHASYGKGMDRNTFVSEGYLHLCRNYLRTGWLNTYLFGSTPCTDETFFDRLPDQIEKLGSTTYYFKYATSLRLSRYGYYSREQDTFTVSYNDLSAYIRDLNMALSTPSKKFSQADLPEEERAVQLNENYLQIPAEHYVRIRPKLIHPLNGSINDTLQVNQVKYVEARDLDVNPFAIEGIELSQLHYLHMFMLYCLFKESPSLEETELKITRRNQDDVSLKGRDPTLMLTDPKAGLIGLKEWGLAILDEMRPIAELLDRAHNHLEGAFVKTLQLQREKLLDSQKTPSARVLEEITTKHESYLNLGLTLAKEHQAGMEKKPLRMQILNRFHAVSQESLQKQKEQEVLDDFILKGYEDMELSTQMVIREARKRKIDIDIIDRNDNFIYLHKNGHSAYVKQATCTARDSYMTYLMMENKVVTKYVLDKNGIRVPSGNVYTNPTEALESYEANKHLVVKPVFTNFGIGVYIIPPGNQELYQKAVLEGFTHGEEVIVEEYCEGEEFRFLIIGDKVLAVCQRLPANVTGDGKHSIKELVKIKNFDPWCYKVPKYRIKLGKHERDFLKRQNLSFNDIPADGQRVYLRANSNVSTGGDPVDLTELVDDSYKAVALKAAKAVKARICGVDMIIKDKSVPQNDQNYAIIELNFNPALLLHRYPVSGKIHYVERDLLDELGF